MQEDILENESTDSTTKVKKPIFDRLIQVYDQTIINNPDWLPVTDCEKVFGMGDRTIRNYAKKYDWKKKYAKVDGTPIVFFWKNDVFQTLKKLGLIDESKIQEASTSSSSENNSGKTAENSAERAVVAAENTQEQQVLPISFQKNLENVISVHKETITELKETKDKLINSEKSRSTWKTNAVWSIAIAFLSIGTLVYFLMNSTKTASELTKNYLDLNSKYQDAQSSLVKAQQKTLEKEEQLMKIQSNSQANQ